MSDEPERLILQLPRDMRAEMADMRADRPTTRKELGEQIVRRRRAVVEYHTTVIGHGVLMSKRRARPRRVEQHPNLYAPDAR